MEKTISILENLLAKAEQYLLKASEEELKSKPAPNKWSKKEILGHLIDSAINNLQRFTEIQYSPKPYPIRKYDQDALVKANDYQNIEIKELLKLWLAINNQIVRVIRNKTEGILDYQVIIIQDQNSDLRFLIKDYVDHLHHHLNQITGK